MILSEKCLSIFSRAIADYHKNDCVDAPIVNPYEAGSFEADLYLKNWIDTIQWHLEDIIRDPGINPVEALALKRRIDKSNQDRTDLVEAIDDRFLEMFKDVVPCEGARLNTETPAWAVDRLSILCLKIYHMREQVSRSDASAEHIERCSRRLFVLERQLSDLSLAIDELLEDIQNGTKVMKTYKQMKMYNDPQTNPILYKKG